MDEYVEGLVPALRHFKEDGNVAHALRLVEAVVDLLSGTANVRTGAVLVHLADQIEDSVVDVPLGCLHAARAIFDEAGFEHGLGACNVLVAELAAATGHEDRAVELYERGLALLDRDVEPAMRGRGWHNFGILLRTLGRAADSLQAQQYALAAYRETGGATGTADCHVGIGLALCALGRPDEALEPYAAARALYLEFGEEELLADVDDRRGHALCELGLYEEAAAAHEAAAARYCRLGEEWLAARSRRYRSHPLEHAGRAQDALAELEVARNVFADAGDDAEVARCDAASAAAFISLGQTAAARPLLDNARRVLAAHDLLDEAEWCTQLLKDPASSAHVHSRR